MALEVARARAGLERARALYTAQRQNAAEATEAFSLASLRFTRGLGTQLETSDAQLALLTAQTNEARTVYDLYLASAELARARPPHSYAAGHRAGAHHQLDFRFQWRFASVDASVIARHPSSP